MAGHSVAANLIMAACLLGGLILGLQVKQEVFPEFTAETVMVRVSYPGATPEEVENGLVIPIENAVQGIDGIDEVTATASEGSASVTVEAVDGTDLQRLFQDIDDAVNGISTFPDEAEKPSVYIPTRKREVLRVFLFGRAEDTVLRARAEELRDRMLENPELTQVEIERVPDREIAVEISQETLRRHGLTVDDVSSRIAAQAVELSGGSIETSGGDVLLRMDERRRTGMELESVSLLSAADGSRVLLGDVAEITDAFEDTDRWSLYNGVRAVQIGVYRVGEQTPVSVAEAGREEIAAFAKTLPPGLGVTVIRDLSKVFKQRADLLLKNAYIGLGLVFVLLAVFLETRLAFWVSMGIPISFLGAFLIFPMTDFSINMITMFAFIISLGIVVDDAIVVGENVYFHRQQGLKPLPAAIKGAQEIAVPVTFSVLTNVAAFMPLFFVPGIMGKVFGMIPVVVCTVFLVSLFESLFVLPAHLAHMKESTGRGPLARLGRRQQRFGAAYDRFVENRFGALLRLVLHYRYIGLAVGVAVLIITGAWAASGRLGFEMFPKTETDYAYAEIELPTGVPEEALQLVQDRLLTAAREVVEENGGDELATGISASVSENSVDARIMLTDPDIRPMSTAEVSALWRRRVGDVAGAKSMSFESDRGGPGSGKALTIQLSHRDVDVLSEAAKALAKGIEGYPGVSEVTDGTESSKTELSFRMLPQGEAQGLTARSVASQVRQAFYGATALTQQRGRDEVKVRVRLPKEERISEYDVQNLVLRTPAGGEMILSEAATVERGLSYASINRKDGRRVVNVKADVNPQSQAGVVLRSVLQDVMPEIMAQYSGLQWARAGKQKDMDESMESLKTGLALALMVIFMMLAIPFNSYIQPAIVMAAIPFGAIGAVAGHMIMGYSLSLMSMMGIVALAGVVVNDSLVLIDFANRRRKGGAEPFSAVLAAGIQRFRPIMLTSLTTFCGLAPMVFETSRQARFMIPMAISLGFGILFATVITLLLVPCMYLGLEDLKSLFRRGEPSGRAHPVPSPQQTGSPTA